MNFPHILFPSWLLISTWVLMIVILLSGLLILKNKPPMKANIGMALFFVMLLWMMNASVKTGVIYHLLGATLLTLTLGAIWAMWVLAIACVIYAYVFSGSSDVWAVGLTFCTMVLPSVGLTVLCLKLARKWLPAHIFVFILGNGFLTAALSFIFSAMIIALALFFVEAYPADFLFKEVLPVYFLMSWGEAFLTGLLTAILVCFAPQYVYEFSDEVYLKNDRQPLI